MMGTEKWTEEHEEAAFEEFWSKWKDEHPDSGDNEDDWIPWWEYFLAGYEAGYYDEI